MFKRIIVTALLAGLLAGLAFSVIQEFTTTPIILHAETFEGKTVSAVQKPAAPDGEEPWHPDDGFERTLFTALSNVLTGIGFALIMVAGIALSGRPVDGRSGVIWGIAGFAVISLAPALGLPPELPGTLTADLGARQGWWLFCVAATGTGLWMLVFRQRAIWVPAGVALMAIPHLIGAPTPERFGGAIPPELAAHFAATSLATAAVFWSTLGWLSGTIWRRFESE